MLHLRMCVHATVHSSKDQHRTGVVCKRASELRPSAGFSCHVVQEVSQAECSMEEEPVLVPFCIPVEKPPIDPDAKLAREARDWFEACNGAQAFAKAWASSEAFHAAFNQFPRQNHEQPGTFHCYQQDEVGQLMKTWLVHSDEKVAGGPLWADVYVYVYDDPTGERKPRG